MTLFTGAFTSLFPIVGETLSDAETRTIYECFFFRISCPFRFPSPTPPPERGQGNLQPHYISYTWSIYIFISAFSFFILLLPTITISSPFSCHLFISTYRKIGSIFFSRKVVSPNAATHPPLHQPPTLSNKSDNHARLHARPSFVTNV